MHSEFMAFISDDESVSVVSSWAERQGFPADSVQAGGGELLASMLESEAPPRLCFVDMDGVDQPVQLAARIMGLAGSAAKMIAIGSANDVGIYRGMLGAGMCDYLVKPLTPESLTQAMVVAMRGSTAGVGAKEARNIIVIGLRGGVGATTIAVNVGWFIAHELKQKCALIDLDLQFGTSALALDIEPGHGFREIVSSPQRVDSLMVSGALVSESDSFAVMSAEEPVDEIVHVDHSAVSMLLKEMRANYRAILIDMPRHLLPTQKRLFAQAQDILLVTEMSLTGIRDTLRVRTALKSLGTTARVTLVATRVGPQRSGAVDEATFTKGAQAPLDFLIPEDAKNVMAASNAGKTLGAIAKGAPIAKSLLQLAQHLVSAQNVADAKSSAGGKALFSGLFSGHKRTSSGES